MARCGCQGGCSCSVQGAGAIQVTGNGSSGTPFVVSADLTELIQAGQGISIDPATGTISVTLSADPSNATTFGTDDGVFTFGGGSGPLAVCDEYFQTDDEGKICLIPGTMGLRQRIVYPVGNASFTKATYPWLARVKVTVQGGGGGSTGATTTAGELIARPGASGGAWAESLLDVGALPAAVAVTVGAGGAAGAAANGNGGAGGTSSFGTLVVAPGGSGGPTGMTAGTSIMTAGGSAGASGAVGQLVSNGGGGHSSFRLSASQGQSGAGGDSQMGIGGYDRRNNGVGTSPSGWGAGAGGVFSQGTAASAGGAGGPGVVIVELYG